jgi:predicted restriction endonuclease
VTGPIDNSKDYQKQYRLAYQDELNLYSRTYHRANREELLIKQRKYYYQHKDENIAKRKEYNKRNKEVLNAKSRQYFRDHIDERRKYCKEFYDTNQPRMLEKARQYRIALRKEIFSHYGNRCACCGEDIYEFLCIDHINGGGNKHRKEVGTGTRFYNWLKNNNYPDGFQILCQNCNSAKGLYGKCPHQKGKE